MVHFDGHEVAILGSVSGFYGITRGIYGPGWIKSMIQRQPVVAMSVALAAVGVAMPGAAAAQHPALEQDEGGDDARHLEVERLLDHPKEIGPAHQPV